MLYQTKPEPFTKKQAERIHAQRRLAERFGNISVKDVKQAIKSGQSKFIKAQSNRVIHRAVEIHGVKMIAVWDKRRKEVITVLYENYNEMQV